MGGIIGSVTDAVGLTDHKGEKKAAEAAANANAQGVAFSKEQIELAKENLDFTKEQYQDWKDIYGEVQENLGKYYNELSGDDLTVLGLEAQQQEFQAVEKSLQRDFAERGISGSGQELEVVSNAKISNATARASIRASSDRIATEEKLKFLGIGLGQGTQLLGTVGNSAANVTNAFSSAVNSRSNATNSYLGRATSLGVANIGAVSDLAGSAAYLAGGA